MKQKTAVTDLQKAPLKPPETVIRDILPPAKPETDSDNAQVINSTSSDVKLLYPQITHPNTVRAYVDIIAASFWDMDGVEQEEPSRDALKVTTVHVI